MLLCHTGRLRLSAFPGGAGAAAVEAAEPAAASTSGRTAADEAAERLDALMEVLFAHLGRRVAAGQQAAAWATLLGAFEAHLLAVPRSKFTQYALWFLADKARPRRCILDASAQIVLRVLPHCNTQAARHVLLAQ